MAVRRGRLQLATVGAMQPTGCYHPGSLEVVVGEMAAQQWQLAAGSVRSSTPREHLRAQSGDRLV